MYVYHGETERERDREREREREGKSVPGPANELGRNKINVLTLKKWF